jgi:hypothetical protein
VIVAALALEVIDPKTRRGIKLGISDIVWAVVFIWDFIVGFDAGFM